MGYLKGKTARWETKGQLGRGTCKGREQGGKGTQQVEWGTRKRERGRVRTSREGYP